MVFMRLCLKGNCITDIISSIFFCVFLECVVGKLSKPLSGRNSKMHVASTAGLIFTKHSSAPPRSVSYVRCSCGSYLLIGMLILKMRRVQVYTDSECFLRSPDRESLPKLALLVFSREVSKGSTPGFLSL